VAVTVTAVEVLTLPLVSDTLAVVFPAAMGRLAGRGNAELLELVSVTCAPPVGAGPFNVTDTVAEAPLVIVGGLIATLAKAGALVTKLKTPGQLPN
jgi:hypothetical protein